VLAVRVIHVVVLASDDGAYGGPLTVALGQAAELRARGHQVDVVAGRLSARVGVTGPDGVPVRTFRAVRLLPGPSVASVVSPALTRWLLRHARSADVVHVHTGRDLLGMGAVAVARLCGRPVVAQTHGMVDKHGRRRARVVDALLTRRLLGRADRHLVLTDQDEAAVRRLGATAGVRRIPNGVPFVPSVEPAPPGPPEVLFCARLHPRKRATVFVEMAALLVDRFPQARFTLVGPDGGDGDRVRRLIERLGLTASVRYAGPVPPDAVLARMRRAAVYVLPSVAEPFPMSLLEALSVGLPAVCTDDTGISDVLAARGAAKVTDGSPRQLADAVAELLERPDARAALVRAGYGALAAHFSVSTMVDVVERAYRDVVPGSVAPPVAAPPPARLPEVQL
jgi:glycosyltransferase involved in cell wall biosynthesis